MVRRSPGVGAWPDTGAWSDVGAWSVVGRLVSEAKSIRCRSSGSPIGVGDDVVWWCHPQCSRTVTQNVPNPSSSTRLRIHSLQALNHSTYSVVTSDVWRPTLEAFAEAHTGSPIGVGDDVVRWCHTQRYQPVILNVTNPSSSTRLRIHSPRTLQRSTYSTLRQTSGVRR